MGDREEEGAVNVVLPHLRDMGTAGDDSGSGRGALGPGNSTFCRCDSLVEDMPDISLPLSSD